MFRSTVHMDQAGAPFAVRVQVGRGITPNQVISVPSLQPIDISQVISAQLSQPIDVDLR